MSPKSKAVLALLALAGGFGSFGEPSAYYKRHDPKREKTPEDLERMEAARIKREKKAAKRNKK